MTTIVADNAILYWWAGIGPKWRAAAICFAALGLILLLNLLP